MKEHVPYTCRDCPDPDEIKPREQFFHSRGRPYGRCKVHYALRKKEVPERESKWRVPVPVLLTCHACREPSPVLDFTGDQPDVLLSQCSGCRATWRERDEEAPYPLGPLDLVEQCLYPGRPYGSLRPEERHRASRITRMLMNLPDLSPPPPGHATQGPDALWRDQSYTHAVEGGRLITL